MCGVWQGLQPRDVSHWETIQREGASALSLSVLPSADGHLSATNLAIHNGVWLWRKTVHCTWGQCFLQCFDTVGWAEGRASGL